MGLAMPPAWSLRHLARKHILSAFVRVLSRYGIQASRIGVYYGTDVVSCKCLPTLRALPDAILPKCVVAFSDGFSQDDRAHVFFLVGSDPSVLVFMCMLGKGPGDSYGHAGAILVDLNKASGKVGAPHFQHAKQFRVLMYGSNASKHLQVYKR